MAIVRKHVLHSIYITNVLLCSAVHLFIFYHHTIEILLFLSESVKPTILFAIKYDLLLDSYNERPHPTSAICKYFQK